MNKEEKFNKSHIYMLTIPTREALNSYKEYVVTQINRCSNCWRTDEKNFINITQDIKTCKPF